MMLRNPPLLRVRGALALVAILAIAPLAAGQVVVIDDPAAAERAEAAKAAEITAVEALANLSTGIKTRSQETILAGLNALDPIFELLSERTLKKVHKAVLGVFKDFRPRQSMDIQIEPVLPGDEPIVGEDPREEVRAAYVMAIGLVYDKPQGDELLLAVLKLKHVRDWPEIHATVLDGLGHRRDVALVGALEAHLGDPSAEVASAAARALGQLHEAPVEARREAVGALIGALEKAEAAVAKELRRAKADDPLPAAERLSSITVAFDDSLKMLTRQAHPDAKAWRAWFGAHGKDPDW